MAVLGPDHLQLLLREVAWRGGEGNPDLATPEASGRGGSASPGTGEEVEGGHKGLELLAPLVARLAESKLEAANSPLHSTLALGVIGSPMNGVHPQLPEGLVPPVPETRAIVSQALTSPAHDSKDGVQVVL